MSQNISTLSEKLEAIAYCMLTSNKEDRDEVFNAAIMEITKCRYIALEMEKKLEGREFPHDFNEAFKAVKTAA